MLFKDVQEDGLAVVEVRGGGVEVKVPVAEDRLVQVLALVLAELHVG
jgi:hypothetical protein